MPGVEGRGQRTHGFDGAGNGWQSGDFHPGAGGLHKRKTRGPEGPAEIPGNGQLHGQVQRRRDRLQTGAA